MEKMFGKRLDCRLVARIFRGGGGCMLPRKKIEIWGLQTAGNALKLLIFSSPCYFCIVLNILRSHQADLFGSWMGAYAPPLPTSLFWWQLWLAMNLVLPKTTWSAIQLQHQIVSSFSTNPILWSIQMLKQMLQNILFRDTTTLRRYIHLWIATVSLESCSLNT